MSAKGFFTDPMDWNSALKSFKTYLQLEKSRADNSIAAYLRDVKKLALWSEETNAGNPLKLGHSDIVRFVSWLTDQGASERTQARVLSGLRGFYEFLELENLVSASPVDLIESPRLGLYLPDTLSYPEIERIIAAVDLSKTSGERDKAMLETLYSCGLRVSELITLRLSHLYVDDGFIRVIGKGNKERLVPIGNSALRAIAIYVGEVRVHQDVQAGHEDFIFLNLRGKRLTRMSAFNIVKENAVRAGIRKTVSPHTFRHSFASHLVEAGADLRAVQEMLGHESITTTEVYTHLDRKYLRDELMHYHPRARKA